jgi:peptidoglycan hydrolase-like protein with peptidoglycan-binding domain
MDVDGFVSAETITAITDFQENQGQNADGIIDAEGSTFIRLDEVCADLYATIAQQWSEFALTSRKLAYRLKDYGIKPGHNTERTTRGYWLTDFSDAFKRYLPPDPSKPSNRPETGDDQG